MRMRIKELADGTNEVDVKTLPDGRTLIHWLRECDDGLIHLRGHSQLRRVMGKEADGKYTVACNPKQNTVNSQKRGSVRFMCMTSGDPDAVTCPKCLATPELQAALATPKDNPKAAQAFADAIKSVEGV